jgi:lysozyme
VLFIKSNNLVTFVRFFLLIPIVLLASKWGTKDHWCTHQTLSLISQFEGFFPKTYRCPAGVPTVGYGHVIADREQFLEDLTQDQALELLQDDLISANDIRPYLTDPDGLEPHQLDALTSLTYNMGYPEIGRSLLVKHINEGRIDASYDFFAPWRGGVEDKILPGLSKA